MSIIGMFKEFNLPKVPYSITQFYIVFEIETDPNEEITVGVRLTNPKGRTMGEVGIRELKMPSGTSANRGWVQFGIFSQEFSEPGKHSIEIIVGKDVVHSVPLQVNWRKG